MALTGFLVAHQCAPTSDVAIRLLQADYPQLAGAQPLILAVTQVTFAAPNTFNMTVTAHSVVGTPQYAISHPLTLALCDPAFPVDVGGTVFDAPLAGALWMFALTIVVGAWFTAKNAGVIISALRRW